MRIHLDINKIYEIMEQKDKKEGTKAQGEAEAGGRFSCFLRGTIWER